MEKCVICEHSFSNQGKINCIHGYDTTDGYKYICNECKEIYDVDDDGCILF